MRRQGKQINLYQFMLRIIVALILIQSCLSDCSQGDRFECATSLCSPFNWFTALNSTTYTSNCQADNTSNCIANSSVPSGSNCTGCKDLTQAECSSICIDWYFNTTGNKCQSCQNQFGLDCIRCSESVCTMCSLSSGTYLANDSLSCTATPCTIANCSSCYTVNGAERCYRCKPNYAVNRTYGCISTTCSIDNCRICNATTGTCTSCQAGYTAVPFQKSCNPVCNEFCVDCIGPNFCYLCITGYLAVDGICVIDCANSIVANCATCSTLSTCLSCNPGFNIVLAGVYCSSICSDANCVVCSSSVAGTCTSCKIGFGLVSGACSSIICNVDFCQTCSDIVTCASCQPQFTLTNGTCSPDCALSITNCILCSSNSTCQVCRRGYYLNNNTCQVLCTIANCDYCGSSSSCDACSSGYALSFEPFFRAETCQLTCQVENCQNCSSPTTCFSCNPDYDLASNGTVCLSRCGFGQTSVAATPLVCQNCGFSIINCYTCEIIGGVAYCVDCRPGYFRDSYEYCSLCSAALSNCRNCSSPSTCLNCQPGFTLVSGKCVSSGCTSAVASCLQCVTNTSQCMACSSGFNLTNGTCSSPSCSASFIFDSASGTCTCPLSSYLGTGGICVNCNAQCKTCSVLGCTSCDQGFFFNGVSCLACPSNCLLCSSAAVCSLCDFYYFSKDGVCVQVSTFRGVAWYSPTAQAYLCPPGCRRCTYTLQGIVECDEGLIGYNFGYKRRMLVCDLSCKTCFGASVTNCTSCYSGNVLKGGSCFACTDSNAISCLILDQSFSTSCIIGFTTAYYLDANGTTVAGGVCRACAANCKKCDQNGPGTCDDGQCFVGYQKLQGLSNCTACLSGCASCSVFDLSCLNCPEGQFGTPGTCQVCDSSCLTCSNTTVCLSCQRGSNLINNTCYAIPAGCATLSLTTGTCSACFQGYSLSNNQCVLDTTCSANSSCVTCGQGFYYPSADCATCPAVCTQCPTTIANCFSCDPLKTTNCLKCVDGYFLSGNTTCTPCPAGCPLCSSTSFCFESSPGYYLVPDQNGVSLGIIKICNSPCATCKFDPNNCLSCQSGWTLFGTKCHLNNNVQMRLVLSGSPNNPIAIDSNVTADNLAAGLSQINRILQALCANLPAANFPGVTPANCDKYVMIVGMAGGSLIVNTIISGGSFANNNAASSAIMSAFASNAVLDGVVVNSATVTANGYVQDDSDKTALIVGLTIGCFILLILIIAAVILIYRYNKENDSSAQTESQLNSQSSLKRDNFDNPDNEVKKEKKIDLEPQEGEDLQAKGSEKKLVEEIKIKERGEGNSQVRSSKAIRSQTHLDSRMF